MGQICGGFDGGEIPGSGGAKGLHALRFREPLGDGELMAMSKEGALEPGILDEKLNDLAMTGPWATVTESLHVAGSEWLEPAPRPT